MTSEIRRFTRECVAKAKVVVENPDEPADWVMLTLQDLRIELEKFYRQTIVRLSEMPGILDEIGLMRFSHFTVLRDWFETIPMETYRAFLG